MIAGRSTCTAVPCTGQSRVDLCLPRSAAVTAAVTIHRSLDNAAMFAKALRFCERYPYQMPENPRAFVTAAEMDKMTPQQRADAVGNATVTSWERVPEQFRAEVMATAAELGAQRRNSV
jgi:hypothetical protein